MAEIVNLRTARKRRQREDAASKAAENRTHFGIPKATRAKAEIEKNRAARDLDGHRLAGDDAADAPGTR